jgi:uncharacterized RmlC-like cupin family protein
MGCDDRCVLVRSDDRLAGPATDGMHREQAVAVDGLWAGFVTTDSGMVSGWHHHGACDSAVYVLSGALRMEFGHGGAESLDAGPGDFVFVPKGAIHRESNPSGERAEIIVVRAGRGESNVNVDGPSRNRSRSAS